MEQNYQTTLLPTTASTGADGKFGGSPWSNPEYITADDGNSASWGAYMGGQGAWISGGDFGFSLPESAVIDGIAVDVVGYQVGAMGDITISPAGTSGKSIGTLNTTYGGDTDLWGASEITPADLEALSVTAYTQDVSGGDAITGIDYISVTVYWHIAAVTAPADVPTRVVYKTYSRDGKYIGELPKVTSQFAFAQDTNSAGSSIEITCGVKAENTIETEPIITGDGEDIITGSGFPLLASLGETKIALGSSREDAIFKNSNRIQVWLYNYWYPNGKLMFSGQVNKVRPKYAGGNSYTKLFVLSDGLDLNNLVARGYPFAYTTDVSQTTSVTYNDVKRDGGKGSGWDFFGQTWLTGASVTNLGAINLRLQGTATVTLSVYDSPNGNLIGSVTKAVSRGSAGVESFEFAQLLEVSPSTSYFWAVSVAAGQTIRLYRSDINSYANGTRYRSLYSGGSGGGAWSALTLDADYYFVTKSGLPTTTTTYSTQDPITGMMSGILADYNARGGAVKERDFTPAGYTLTYTFNMDFIYSAMKKIIEMSPAGYNAYIDLGTAEMDIFPMSQNADYTVVNGNDVLDLELELSIEQVKNYLLLTGAEVAGANLYRDYQDSESAAFYGIRTDTKSDNRLSVTATMDAIGSSFIDENSDETQETALIVPVTAMDTTLLIPGKTIGFRNYGSFIDSLVLPIVRREFNPKYVKLTLGRLPVRMSDEVQRIQRGLLQEQTAKNPSAPS